MTVSPHHTGEIWAQYSGYSQDASDDLPAMFQVAPEERVGAPFRRRGRALRRLIALALLVGGGWAVVKAPPEWRARAFELAAQVPQLIAEHRAAQKSETPPAAPAAPPPAEPVKEIAQAPAPPASEAVAAAPVAPVESQGAAEAEAAVSAESAAAAPQKVERAENLHAGTPEQAKAIAAGLHPDISRAVLTRLSAADFKNAGIAIKTALAETPDDKSYSFPKAKKAGQAVFDVHFVNGAPADCRRYVTTVTLDGWSTTAAPMEKCGLKRKAAGLVAKKATAVE